MTAQVLQPGTVISGYRIEGLLGYGAMGVVYRALQENLGRHVALKVIYPEKTKDPEFIRRFLNEARAAASLDHPGIVRAYDAGCWDGTYFFAMEYVEGETLQSIIDRRGRLEIGEALTLAETLASVLAYGWNERHLIHGDIKPENIMVDTKGRLKLMDLGVARIAQQAHDGSAIMLTPLYAAPELIRGEVGQHGIASDVYAFGATLYHMLAGHPPFPGTDPQTVMRKQVEAPPPKIHVFFPQIPVCVSDMLDRTLLKNPGERFRTWEEIQVLLQDLRLHCEKEVDEIEKISRQLPPPAAPARRADWISIVLVVAAIALTLGIAWLAVAKFSGGEATPKSPPTPAPTPSPTPPGATPASEPPIEIPETPAVVPASPSPTAETPTGPKLPAAETPVVPPKVEPPAAPATPKPNPAAALGAMMPFDQAMDARVAIFYRFGTSPCVLTSPQGVGQTMAQVGQWLQQYQDLRRTPEYAAMEFFYKGLLKNYLKFQGELSTRLAATADPQWLDPTTRQQCTLLRIEANGVWVRNLLPGGRLPGPERLVRWSAMGDDGCAHLADCLYRTVSGPPEGYSGYLGFLLHETARRSAGQPAAETLRPWNALVGQVKDPKFRSRLKELDSLYREMAEVGDERKAAVLWGAIRADVAQNRIPAARAAAEDFLERYGTTRTGKRYRQRLLDFLSATQ